MSLKPKRDPLSLQMSMALVCLLVLFGASEPRALAYLLAVGLPCIAVVRRAEKSAARRARCIDRSDRHAPTRSQRKTVNHVR